MPLEIVRLSIHGVRISLLALPVTEIGIAWLGFALWREKGGKTLARGAGLRVR